MFVTAAILSKLLLFFNANIATDCILNKQAVLLALSVVFIYSADHFKDNFYTSNLKKLNWSVWLNAFTALLSFACILALVFAFQWFRILSFQASLISIIPVLVYFIIQFQFKNKLNGFKELLIAFSVLMAVFYPSIAASKWDVAKMIYVFLPLLANTIIFSLFEFKKDKSYGFVTIFSGIHFNKAKGKAIKLLSGLLAMEVLLWYLSTSSNGIGGIFCIATYLFMAFLVKNLEKTLIYRLILELNLLFLLLI